MEQKGNGGDRYLTNLWAHHTYFVK